MSRLIPAFAFAIVLLGLTATRARADLAINLSNVTVAPGDMGTMDITVTSNANDTLSSFNLELLITRGSSASFLTFTSNQPDFSGNPNFVFYGASTLGPAFWGPPYQPSITTGYPSDSITGGDFNSSAQGYVTIPATAGGAYSYLAAVQFQAQTGAPLTDQFQISLVNNPNFTYFDDQYGNPLAYTSSGGTVTLASAVPEPSSLTVVVLSSLCCLLWCCWRGRKHGQSKDSPLRERKKVDIAL